ncbi:DUF4375 domain-containing protein [Affinibrenneria salicis]|uniref:DUF4375 domain-containing protein n=1 Tax=Affinibrenneria salicis TaxID=2590031 RepID=A0A5J5FWW7_9GAMM|nr:DUF4375 domain-containing protein [Affinibrenneria salicis]KAA8998432.1 DUF4375 domain-containing protein [Affinibrenneria salicis]
MMKKQPCSACGALILPTTADRNGGMCMPCKNGIRENIEKAKAFYQRERKLDKNCPFRALWRQLIDKVHHQPGGFEALSAEEKIYYAVNVLEGEVYNGGFMQFFDNASKEYDAWCEQGLARIDAPHSLRLLRAARLARFGDGGADRLARGPAPDDETWARLNDLDHEFYQDPDGLEARLNAFAMNNGLTSATPE